MYKKYDKIKNRGFKLENFDSLVVEEKLDGANASFTYDADKQEMLAFSRNTQLSENNTLNGFYGLVQEMFESFSNIQLEFLANYIIYGEWLTKHKVNYKEEAYKTFFAFDAYNKITERYESYEFKKTLFEFLGLQEIETFLVIEEETMQNLTSKEIIEEINGLIGKSSLTAEPNTGEGVVIKSLETRGYHDESFKFVTDAFKETKSEKSARKPKQFQHPVDYAVTRSRLEKIIHKKLDEQELSKEDLSLQNFSQVMKLVAPEMQSDILEEEMDVLIKNIKQRIGKQIPQYLREILEEYDRADSDV